MRAYQPVHSTRPERLQAVVDRWVHCLCAHWLTQHVVAQLQMPPLLSWDLASLVTAGGPGGTAQKDKAIDTLHGGQGRTLTNQRQKPANQFSLPPLNCVVLHAAS